MNVLHLKRPHRSIDLDSIDAPMALCSIAGDIDAATQPALDLMLRLALLETFPGRLPRPLWHALERVRAGDALEWRPPGRTREVLLCTRYPTASGFLVVLRVIADEQDALSRRLHRQRLETAGRLVAGIAHDLRNAVTCILYSADFLERAAPNLTLDKMCGVLQELGISSRRLQLIVEGVLDYARLGPLGAVSVNLQNVVDRALRFLRPLYLNGTHRARVELCAEAQWVRGNPRHIEQILINLLMNAAEAANEPRNVSIQCELARAPGSAADAPEQVRVRVWDDGPGVPHELDALIFDPFFTTKEHGTGLGLSSAREAAQSLEGELILERLGSGACFTLFLPKGTPEA